GLKYAFDALNIVHQKYPDLVVMMFGAPKRPNVPKWYEYYSNISSKEVNLLYNKCSIFLCASIKEGFGLTGAESMAAG
ncbi:glycosyltransferase, partial [Mycobacterium kansasii]